MTRTDKPDLRFVLLALAWMAVIFGLSAQPKNEIPVFGAWDLLVKKGGHMLEYAVLAWLWHRAWGQRSTWLAWGLAVVYAASDEFHQSFVPGRHAQWADVGVDAVGAALGLGLAGYIERPARLVFKIVGRIVSRRLGLLS